MRAEGWGRTGLAAVGASLLGTVAVAAAGPSLVEPPLPGRPGQPPYALALHPPDAAVAAVVSVALLLGALGTLALLAAIRRGWYVDPRYLAVVGVGVAAVLACLPPVGSPDHLSYAGYGRITATGHSPYTTTPAELSARGDPVARAVEPPWRSTTSVYGPVATAEQAAASAIGGASMRLTVFALSVANAVAFAATALLLHRVAPDQPGRLRAAVLWAANPLVIAQLVAGAHLDTLVAALAIGALALALRAPLLAGVTAAAAVDVKLSAALVVPGVLWAARRRAGWALVGVVAASAPAYLLIPHALTQTARAASYVSRGTPWRPVANVLDDAVGHPDSRAVIKLLAAVAAVAVAVVVLRALRRTVCAGPPLRAGAAVAFAVTVGWLLTAPYVLPWYDGLAYALLALVAFDVAGPVLVAHTLVLGLAYVPGRVVVPTPVTTTAVLAVAPALLTVVIAALVWRVVRLRTDPPP